MSLWNASALIVGRQLSRIGNGYRTLPYTPPYIVRLHSRSTDFVAARILQAMETQVMSVIDEVHANQKHLRSRLARATSTAPHGLSVHHLPSVPLIDLAKSFSLNPSDHQVVASEIRKACTSSGFFQISNHGISNLAIVGILIQAEAFFQTLTPAEKDAPHIRHSKIFPGYEARGDTYVNPDDNSNDSAEVETKEVMCPQIMHLCLLLVTLLLNYGF